MLAAGLYELSKNEERSSGFLDGLGDNRVVVSLRDVEIVDWSESFNDVAVKRFDFAIVDIDGSRRNAVALEWSELRVS